MKNNGIICFRLRKKRDMDLITALSEIEEGEVSDLIRKGLRVVLGDVIQNRDIEKAPPKSTKWSFPK